MPTEPSPNAQESLRRAAVTDAQSIQDMATAAAATTTNATVKSLLTQAAGFAGQHITALGGVYHSGLEKYATPSSSPTSSSTAPASATVEDTIEALVAAATRQQDAANTSTDDDLAYLLASIGVSEQLSAKALASQTGSKAAASLPAASLPAKSPTGATAADLSSITEQEDAAGYAYEIRAARSSGQVRDSALSRASIHRDRAQAWATVAKIANTAQDPRRAAYDVPLATVTTTLPQTLEGSLATSYADMVAATSAGSRKPLEALLADSASAAIAAGATPTAFPGMSSSASATAAPSSTS